MPHSIALKSGWIMPRTGGMFTMTHEKDGITFPVSVPVNEDFLLITVTLTTGYNKLAKPVVTVRRKGEYNLQEVLARVEAFQATIENAQSSESQARLAELDAQISELSAKSDRSLLIAIILLFLCWPVSIYFFWRKSQLEEQMYALMRKRKEIS